MSNDVFVKAIVFFFCLAIALSIVVSIADLFRIKSALKTLEEQRESTRKATELTKQIKNRYLEPFEATGYTISRLDDGSLKIVFKKPSDEDADMFYLCSVIVKKGTFIEKAFRNVEDDGE